MCVVRRQFWLEGLQEQAIEVHHEQRSRATVPSYGQALALGNLMEQMHLEVRCSHKSICSTLYTWPPFACLA